MAQRVMDCGDVGHILVSKHMAEDLEQYGQWKRHLHDLGQCEVKHGVRVSVVINLYTEITMAIPKCRRSFGRREKLHAPMVREKKGRGWVIAVAVVLIAALIIGAVLFCGVLRPSRLALRTAAACSLGYSDADGCCYSRKEHRGLAFENLSHEPG